MVSGNYFSPCVSIKLGLWFANRYCKLDKEARGYSGGNYSGSGCSHVMAIACTDDIVVIVSAAGRHSCFG